MGRSMTKARTQTIVILMALLLAASSALTACKKDISPLTSDGGNTTDNSNSIAEELTGSPLEAGSETVTPETAPETVAVETPTEGKYDLETDGVVRLTGTGADIQGDGVTVSGSVVTFTKAGTYLVSGTLTDGQLVVDTQDGEKVKLILNGVSVTNRTGPAVLVRSAPKKAILYTAADSVNLFADGTDYVVPEEEQTEGGLYPNACMYACDDLKLDGEGILQVTGNADKGINTKDDLEIAGGTLNVCSVGTAVRGKDSVEMTGGTVTLTVTGEGDGMKTANTEDEGKGMLSVSGGSLFITSIGDALSAATDLSVTGGHIVVTTLDVGGKELSSSTTSGTVNPGFGGRPGGFGGMGEGNSNKPSISAKGLKAGHTVSVSGGKLTLTTVDDGIHSGDSVVISDGELYIRAGDDGIHADKVLTISGGNTEIAQSYEGLEANKINILGGTNRITASDDGTNANGGTTSGMGGVGGMRPGRPGQPGSNTGSTSGDSGTAQATDTPLLTIAGGYTVVNAAGDGLDSNGNIVMTGGVIYVFGPSDNGNGAIDYGDGNYSMTISGGTLLAVGSSGMAQAPSNNGQAVFAASFRSALSAGTSVGLTDESGKVICAFELPKSISSFVFSSPEIRSGETYTLVYNGTSSATAADGVIPADAYAGYTELGSTTAQ